MSSREKIKAWSDGRSRTTKAALLMKKRVSEVLKK